MTTMQLSLLTQDEQTNLRFLEHRMDQALDVATAASITLATCLKEIHSKRLYRAYGTFDDYCRERWQKRRVWGYRLIEAAQVLDTLTADENVSHGIHLPENERQLRPLAQLPSIQQPAAWERALDLAAQEQTDVAARHVQQAVSEYRVEATPPPAAAQWLPLDAINEPDAAHLWQQEPSTASAPIVDDKGDEARHDRQAHAMHLIEDMARDAGLVVDIRTSDEDEDIPLELPQPKANHQLLNSSESNEWYTPKPYIEAARLVMGGIDTDPASNPLANATIGAATYYTQDTNGFDKPWTGRVFLNPPYGKDDDSASNQARWSARLVAQYRAGITNQAILLVNAVPGNLWFAPLWDFPICFVSRRIRFYNADTEAGQPTHSNVFVYLGPNVAAFVQAFSPFGPVAGRLREDNGHVSISIEL